MSINSQQAPAFIVERRADRHSAWNITGGFTDGLALPYDLPELVVKAVAAFAGAEVAAALKKGKS